jgi:hypothetical protein
MYDYDYEPLADVPVNEPLANVPDTNKPQRSPRRNTRPAIIEPTAFKYRPAIEIPKRAWLYGRHYLRNCVTVTVAPPGWTKSTRSLTELMAMALLRPLLGKIPTSERPLRCWYWSGEDECEEVERRIAAICQHHRIDARTLEGLLFYDSFQEIPITICHSGAQRDCL